ncbi:MAG TPA: response regulator [Thermoanaerobaculia bacterium]|nr:response regulator [Thermoanaerobaculia bacterium]
MARKRLILIADDNSDWRTATAQLLEAWGYEVAQAMDGKEALRKTTELKPDALLLDLMMPRESGWQLLRQLRERSEFRRLPVVLVSGWPSERARAQELGVQEVLAKPVEPELLRETLERLGVAPAGDGGATSGGGGP